MPAIDNRILPLLFLPLALAFAAPANAQSTGRPDAPVTAQSAEPAALPAWDQLTDAQREALVAPIRDRWNAHPGKRARMLAHAERWQAMDAQERARAHRGADRWRHLDPEKREAMRALYSRMKVLPEAERAALRTRWKAMSPEERRAWVRANPAPVETPAPTR